MTVLLIFLGATITGLAVAYTRHRSLGAAWPLALRAGLSVMFLTTGVTHFIVLREDLIALVPPGLPAPGLLLTVTGALEIAGAVGVLFRPTAAWAAGGLALLLMGVFPANVYAAASGATLAGEPATALAPRAAIQVLYLAAAVAVLMTHRRFALRPSSLRGVTVSPPQAKGPAWGGKSEAVLVSRLEVRSVRQVPGLLLASLRLRRALRHTTGAVSLALAVQPLARTFWTWSVWADEHGIREYVRSGLHVEVMRHYGAYLRDSRFRIVGPESAPQTWADARTLALSSDRVPT